MGARPAAGGGRWLEVSPERIGGWLAGFDKRHRVLRSRYADVVTFEAADGAVAECHPPFPPIPPFPSVPPFPPVPPYPSVPPFPSIPPAQPVPTVAGDAGCEGLVADPLVRHVSRSRVVGVLLVRLGGHAAGVFEGERLVASKVGSRLVQSRTAAGGWSQQRFARRREGQAAKAAEAAAEDAARVLLPRLSTLDAVVLGGERRAVDAVGADRRLAPVFALATPRFLTTPDPKLAVLQATPRQFRAVQIRLVEPA